LTIARIDAAPVSTPRIVRVFLNFFCFVLAGYVLLGKNFAYLGFPPLYIGEVALALGIAAALTAGNLTSAILNLPGLALALLMVWTALRTIPYWDEYGLDALRDAMLVFYGLFAYIVASLILQRAVILTLLIERYKRFIPCIIFLSPIIPMVGYISGNVMVGGWYLQVGKVGDLSCHLTAVIAFSLIGFVRLRLKTLIFILLIELFTFSQGREAMLAFIVGCSVASAFSPNRHALRRVLAIVGVSAVVLSILGALDFQIPGQKEGRDIAVRQLVINATSVFTNTGSERADVTKEWRLNWWSDIIDYTVHGPYFWNGKGFGPSLADLDGYQVGDPESGPPLRSPHNAHMTILARGGVPALVLWIGALGSWLVAVMHQLIEAKKLRDEWWACVFAFLLTYWMIMVVSGSFDVALEGPVLGIWFWTIHGIGLAALILHRHRVATLQDIHFRVKAGVT
jgi:hypothetical protein